MRIDGATSNFGRRRDQSRTVRNRNSVFTSDLFAEYKRNGIRVPRDTEGFVVPFYRFGCEQNGKFDRTRIK